MRALLWWLPTAHEPLSPLLTGTHCQVDKQSMMWWCTVVSTRLRCT